MPNDGSSLSGTYEPQTVAYTEMYNYDRFDYAVVMFPIKDIYGRISRYEERRMHRTEIEQWNRDNA